MLYANILETVGNTPIVKLNKIGPKNVNIYVKIESFNPMGSVKDRLARNVIEQAENDDAKAALIVAEDARDFLNTVTADKEEPVVMFALEWCEFSWSVRKIFAHYGIPYRSVDLDSVANTSVVRRSCSTPPKMAQWRNC